MRGTLAGVLYLHHVPGRLRVRLALLRRNGPAVIALRARLLALEGVTSVSINPVTGSIIIYYDRQRFAPQTFWMALRHLGFLDHAPQCLRQCQADARTSVKAADAAAAAVQIAAKTIVGALLEQCMLRSANSLIRLFI